MNRRLNIKKSLEKSVKFISGRAQARMPTPVARGEDTQVPESQADIPRG